MRAVIFEEFGEPATVLKIRERPVPEPGPGEVRVRMIASPVNPSDLLVVRGEYGRLPKLPATPGFEGVGRVEAAGGGLLARLRRGRRVAVLNGQGGNWAEYVVVPARQVVPVAANVPDEQAATFFVNPASAFVMTRLVLRVPRGAWLAQTAAGSALGRMVIRLGKHFGFRTLNLVRRRETADKLLRLGADAVVCTAEEDIDERVRALTRGEGVPFAIDAVGGPAASALLKVLAPGGRLLVYGTLSGEPLSIDPRLLMVNRLSVAGFWLSNWVREQRPIAMLRLFRRLNRLMAAGVLTSEVAASFPLDQVLTAVQSAATPGRTGKVLLRMGSG